MTRLLNKAVAVIALALGLVQAASAQAPAAGGPVVPVPVGKGSYASAPPSDVDAAVRQMADKTIPLAGPVSGAIPTNHWWSDLLVHPIAGQLWAFPLMVKPDDQGLNVFFPIRWNDAGTDPVSDSPLPLRGADFHPTKTLAKNWGDWTVTFRETESADRYWDVTLGRGLPYVWLEPHGVSPQLALPPDATLFDAAGSSLSLPMTGDQVGVSFAGRRYGIYLPTGTRCGIVNGALGFEFPAGKSFLVVCPLTKAADLPLFHQFAYAVPRDSRMTWTYSPERAAVTTDWHLETQPLQGTETRLIQGWLPHHYRDSKNTLAFNDLTYLTPRGTLKCSVGTDFRLTYPFHGFPPFLPAPHATGLPHDFSEARMRGYLSRYATRIKYGDDTYWGGKDLTQWAQYMTIAHEMHDPSFGALRDSLRAALADWFTYTPGETSHYFARYPNWGALIGIKPSYGSEGFNDNHFHYGYFTTSAAMLGMVDPPFLTDYGPMARLVAKEYANWDRTDTRFPFLRCFDIWEGHSWASGLSSPTGTNQESSSEAMQSWGGLFLLGTALHDRDMAAAGAMGYAMESQAVQEYWFNAHGGNFAPNNPHPITSMVWGGGDLYGTYFSGDPAWIWGIQWLPMSPMLSYLVQDPAFAKESFRTMLAARKKSSGTDAIAGMGTALGNVVLGEAGQVNPDWAAEQMDALWDSNDPITHDNDVGGLMYYFAHAHRDLGDIQWDYHMSLPTSCVYRNARTGAMSYVVFNPLSTPQRVTVFRGAAPVGSFVAPGRALVRRATL